MNLNKSLLGEVSLLPLQWTFQVLHLLSQYLPHHPVRARMCPYTLLS